MKLSAKASLAALAAGLAFATAACSGSDAGGDDVSVGVSMKDWEIALDPTTAPAGAITFDVTNDGPTTHEFEIFSGDVDPATLPVESGVAVTDGLTLIDEVEDVTAGSTAELSVDLEPGSYALLCNLADHYQEGMYTTLVVE
ncbi:MAG: cupredoxin domain-containing protein [Actinomycetota bacterium]